ncbi:MAG: Gfo/Idh/MocA family oxidoreductase [Planctomycetes bacterium]|nr:Gfo/Idh/MocA family oxidoreductase [Planctomycetota bacterium]
MGSQGTNGGGEGAVSRREFIGSATLTVAGVATGLSYYFSRPSRHDYSEFLKPESQVRLAYIGVGNRGGSLLRSSLQAPGCFPVAVADIREAQRKEFVDKIKKESQTPLEETYQPADYADYRRVLDRKDVEAVVIATPHYLHAPMAMDALEAGKHVYCEKAMAYTIKENQDLARLVRAKGDLVFQVGHQRRYSLLYQRVKELIQAGAIGEVAAIRAQWNQNQVERRPCPDPVLEKIINWRLYSEFSGGLTTEFASHQVDVANWMVGTHPDSVCGYGGVDWYQDGRDTADNVHILFDYKVPIPGSKGENGGPRYRHVKLAYTSMMQNAHLGPSELILGTRGTLEACLSGGAELFKEKVALEEEAAQLAAKAGKPGGAKKALRAGATIAPSCLKRPKGELVEVPEDKRHWVKFTKPLEGAYDTGETFLAVGAFLDTIRAKRAGSDVTEMLKASVTVGLEGAVPCLMANIAMRENRTVHWSEFFPEETASAGGTDAAGEPKRGG